MRVVLSGPDGSGKSTIVNNLSRHLEPKGRTHVTWRRFGFVFGRILNFFARLAGWSFYETTPAGKIGYHRYRGIWAVAYIVLVWVDCKLIIGPKWRLKDYYRRHDNIIVDRFYIDIVADLILSTNRTRTVIQFFDKILRTHINESCCFIVSCRAETVMSRRPDIYFDRDYSRKVRNYTLLRRLYRLNQLETDKLNISQCIEKVVTQCE